MNNLLEKIINYYRPGELAGNTRQINCFFHGPDNAQSARYYADTDSYYCFACGTGGGPLWFVKELEEISYDDAKKWLETNFGVSFQDIQKEATELEAYEKVIVDLVIAKKPKKFLKIYRELDLALAERDINRLRYLFDGLKNR